MTSKERVKRAIHFDSPDMIPAQDLDLFRPVSYAPSPTTWQLGEEQGFEIGRDIWGGVHKRDSETGERFGQMAPVLGDWDDLATYEFPTETPVAPAEEEAQAKIDELAAQDKYVVGGSAFGMWYWLVTLRGYENVLMDMVTDPDLVRDLWGCICQVYKRMISKFKDMKCDAVWFNEDLGTTTGPIFSPALYQDVLAPGHADLYGHAHDLGLDVFLYAAGDTTPLWGPFIDAGVDALVFRENKVIGTRKAAELLRGRCCAYASTDITYTNPTADHDKIAAEIRENVECFHRPEGGYIAEVMFMFLKGAGESEWARRKTYELIGRGQEG